MGINIRPPHMYLLSELAENGSLFEALYVHKIKLTWEQKIAIGSQICAGLLYLHSQRPAIVHRDVKSPNILVLFDKYSYY